MATYTELQSALENVGLKQRIRVACLIAADLVRQELDTVPNHTLRLAWAKSVYQNPDAAADAMILAVIAQNAAFTLAQIIGASDASVQTAVNNAVNVFAQ